MDARAGADGTGSYGDESDMFWGAQRGIYRNGKSRWMSLFDFIQRLLQIQGMYRVIEGTVNMNIFPMTAR